MNILCCCIFTNCIACICVKICRSRYQYNNNHNHNNNNNNNNKYINLDSVIVTYEKTDDDDDTIVCPITQEEILKGEIIKKLPCGHKFSKGINNWVISNNFCPVCREKVIELV